MLVPTRAAKKKSAAVAADALANNKADELLQRRLRREKYEKERERIFGLRTRAEKTLGLNMVKNPAGRSGNNVAVVQFVHRATEGALGQNPGRLPSFPQKASQDRVSLADPAVEDTSNNPKSNVPEKDKRKEKVPEKSCEDAEKTSEDNAMKLKKMEDRLKTLNDYNYGSFIVALYGSRWRRFWGRVQLLLHWTQSEFHNRTMATFSKGNKPAPGSMKKLSGSSALRGYDFLVEKKLTTFLVETKNVSFGKTEKNVSGIASIPVTFDKVMIPFNFVVGAVGQGLEIASEARLQFKAKNNSNTVDYTEKKCKGDPEKTTKGGFCKKTRRRPIV